MTDHRTANRYWGSKPLPKTKTEFFDAVTTPAPSGSGTVATIRMYGPIDSWGGFWGVSANDVGKVLDALPDSVTRIILRVNSPGGEVFEGVSILNMLRAHKASVTAVVDGLAASAASVIAAGADDTVMSPGTQMMIHSPSVFAFGNAVDLRKQADVLDSIESSLIEIYAGKAGDKDWPALLADDTWMSATEAVAAGLADRVAVIPDAGETETVGDEDDDEQLIVIPDEEISDSAASRVLRIVARATPSKPTPADVARAINSRAQHAPRTTRPAEPGTPNTTDTKGGDHMAALSIEVRNRLGLPAEGDVDDATILAAVDRVAAPAPTNTVPEGTRLVDAAQFDQLVADAAAGREARAQQVTERRDGIVQNAVRAGKIAPARAEHWRAALDADEEGVRATLDSLAEGLVAPIVPLGHTGGVDESASDEDALYSKVFGHLESKGA
ncbi:head maturation protease, ClpP-related [Curtobacterium sp. MCBD17_028]|uniref:head maturation protease, ClpP-related n=1 Tax=Curtobacterium sp. MCBD17_028 TaxID=2175670 RepID=UPI000DA85CB2|nr:head maturation protease, ClpP-related [Curtobacterium sp. MCBD17_028]PZE23863.1 hypothetical protein DEI86_13545 [Curtobacterium sp. MCBD17_028]